MGKYRLKEEHKAQIPEHVKKWEKIILNTDRLSQDDKKLCVDSVNKLYDIAKLPRPKNIVFVSSPLVLAFSAGLARYILNNDKKFTSSVTDKATRTGTRSAIYSAIRKATFEETYRFTRDAIYNTFSEVTWEATRNVTYTALRDVNYINTGSAIYSATKKATFDESYMFTRNEIYSVIHEVTYNPTWQATRRASNTATRKATYISPKRRIYDKAVGLTDKNTGDAVYSAVYKTVDENTRSAIWEDTWQATRRATYTALRRVTDKGTRRYTRSATYTDTRRFTELGIGVVCHENFWSEVFNFLNKHEIKYNERDVSRYIQNIFTIWQGGCNSAQSDCFLSFFQDIAKLNIDYSKYQLYRNLTVAGYRVLDRDFAMISEKPTKIVTKDNLAHNFNGPAIEYMDGSKLYMLYGNLVPSYIITTPVDEFTKETILKEKNADYRRYIIERIGIERYINLLGAKVIDTFESQVGGTYELLLVNINGQELSYLKMKNQSIDEWHVEGVPPDTRTVQEAIMFRNGLKNFAEPKYLS